MDLKHRNTQIVKRLAAEQGFDLCGISKAEKLDDEARKLEEWLHQGRNGQMAWMHNYFDKRIDPRELVPGAKSVITVILNYYPEKPVELPDFKISRYAYGKDYHYVIKDKLKAMLEGMIGEIGDIDARVFTDSAPVMDKVWAKKSGLGWQGKHTLMINRNIGSFFFIGEIICDLELEPDGPVKDYCGTCTACIDACPTDAIIAPYQLDAGCCISYLTIELRDAIPDEFQGKMEGWAFGCDICQEVCPWNKFAKPHNTPEFEPREAMLEYKDWEEVTHEIFVKIFPKSAVKRAKPEGFKRNLEFLKKK